MHHRLSEAIAEYYKVKLSEVLIFASSAMTTQCMVEFKAKA